MAKDYDIAKPAGLCHGSNRELVPGEAFVAVLRESDGQLLREDYCLEYWQAHPCENDPSVVGTWRTHVPEPQQKKKLLIDNELLMNLFERLDGADEPARINFRYVLTLILMRKKLLVYDHMEKDGQGRNVWRLRVRGTDRMHEVIDPSLDEDQIAEVSEHLNEIMEEPI